HDLPSSPATLDELLREDVIPYTALMPELDAIMLAHVEFPAIDAERPASLSPRIIRRFLRDQLGFDRHVILTDDLDMGAIASRYGRGEDARLAIEAGNDLALICHQAASAPEAAAAIATLPLMMRDEAMERVERLRLKKLQGPLVWSEPQWAKTCAALADLAAMAPEMQAPPPANSPVEDY
ncbi:MAG TPA: glycoside hydrolase family 3 N-terminal domain-containing protein, partial [Luteolibacter sp.]|nr:glycoside hydrolase family 3 N-terminal domain-containing protein [Luteolibacter sp.]